MIAIILAHIFIVMLLPKGGAAMAGTKDKLEGKTKEAVGRVTGDRDLESQGKGQHAVGKVKDAADAVKDKAKDVKEQVTDR
jgi:uncharacterized protein YjbJ (UPF0337 family)